MDAACLPEGNEGRFRIRTFNGIVIHSVPNSNSLSTKSQALSDQCAVRSFLLRSSFAELPDLVDNPGPGQRQGHFVQRREAKIP